jgi:hypothetical protein
MSELHSRMTENEVDTLRMERVMHIKPNNSEQDKINFNDSTVTVLI